MPATIISVDGRMHHFETHLCKQIPSVFLSFFSRVLAKQTFAHVLYPEMKKKKKEGSIKRLLIHFLLYLSPTTTTIYHDGEKKESDRIEE